MFTTLIVVFFTVAFIGLVIYAYAIDNKWNTTDK